MRFNHYDLGYLGPSDVVEITLSGNAANVRLMDSGNLAHYRAGRQHRFVGGRATRSPVRLPIPHSAHWHVVVDMQGLRGSVKSSVRVMPKPLPPIAEPALSSVPSLVREVPPVAGQAARMYDVFTCHASEDKDDVVRPLAAALREAGLQVWYDEYELGIGSSLRRKIDEGIATSRFGVVVLSEAFFGKGWSEYELDGLVTRAVSGEQIILPVWHGVTKEQVIAYSPSLADKVARSTATRTVAEIADEIAALVG